MHFLVEKLRQKREGRSLSLFSDLEWRMFSPETKHISHTVGLKNPPLMFRCFQEARRIINEALNNVEGKYFYHHIFRVGDIQDQEMVA